MICRNADNRLVDLFLKIKTITGGRISYTLLKTTISVFAQLRNIRLKSGRKGLVLYLKALAVCLQQAASGHLLQDLTPLKVRVSRTKGSKLPRIISASHRQIIGKRIAGWHFLIKFYLTIFYIYRVISFTPLETLDTITSPGREFSTDIFERFIPRFLELFVFRNKPELKLPLGALAKFAKIFIINRSSPVSTLIT